MDNQTGMMKFVEMKMSIKKLGQSKIRIIEVSGLFKTSLDDVTYMLFMQTRFIAE